MGLVAVKGRGAQSPASQDRFRGGSVQQNNRAELAFRWPPLLCSNNKELRRSVLAKRGNGGSGGGGRAADPWSGLNTMPRRRVVRLFAVGRVPSARVRGRSMIGKGIRSDQKDQHKQIARITSVKCIQQQGGCVGWTGN